MKRSGIAVGYTFQNVARENRWIAAGEKWMGSVYFLVKR